VEELQERVAGAINDGYEGRIEKVLFQGTRRGRWYGRTRTDKLVFVTSEQPLVGQLVDVRITRTSPWALQGDLV
jgi:tRNA-2-methylthio-N6-dimethylallyladenosine synthase